MKMSNGGRGMNKKTNRRKLFIYLFLILLAVVMVYPLVYLFFASFKPNDEIFGSASLLPKKWVLDSYKIGWRGSGQFTYGRFLLNTCRMVVPTVVFTVISSLWVGYGFARFDFPLKKFWFYVMIGTMMLPSTVIIIPRYILFKNLGWIDTYLPFIVPAVFAGYPFFVYMGTG